MLSSRVCRALDVVLASEAGQGNGFQGSNLTDGPYQDCMHDTRQTTRK